LPDTDAYKITLCRMCGEEMTTPGGSRHLGLCVYCAQKDTQRQTYTRIPRIQYGRRDPRTTDPS
jgi:hypothetical protein